MTKPESLGTHLPLGYASIGLSRQAGEGKKQERDASKPLATSAPKQITKINVCACVLPVQCPHRSTRSLQHW